MKRRLLALFPIAGDDGRLEEWRAESFSEDMAISDLIEEIDNHPCLDRREWVQVLTIPDWSDEE
jgi:hypothetical protein